MDFFKLKQLNNPIKKQPIRVLIIEVISLIILILLFAGNGCRRYFDLRQQGEEIIHMPNEYEQAENQ